MTGIFRNGAPSQAVAVFLEGIIVSEETKSLTEG